ncbi:hypothetical protein E8E13_005083 [Curvularia kusanoi]|uniref:Dienelactone hydrolase domain-containing protein n=1 Tax=Curvularia kusanoi TaxID=90978 RepID=A0A9P4W4B7_CURKU|nr:hypothetical protein E8E13_005083 [Curvularia kusanoi]
MSCSDCATGFEWEGTSDGREEKLNGRNVYATGSSSRAAILVIPDLFGWTLPNVRMLADRYAYETNSTVYVADFFDGEVVDPEILSDPSKSKSFDMMAFLGRNGKEQSWPEIQSAAQSLKSRYPKLGVTGFCYGGWGSFRLSDDPSLVDAISVAHPSLLDEAEIAALKVPVQILSPANDHYFTGELKQFTIEALSKAEVQWEYIYFPRMRHGFAVRGNMDTEEEKNSLDRAARSAVSFFNEFLR